MQSFVDEIEYCFSVSFYALFMYTCEFNFRFFFCTFNATVHQIRIVQKKTFFLVSFHIDLCPIGFWIRSCFELITNLFKLIVLLRPYFFFVNELLTEISLAQTVPSTFFFLSFEKLQWKLRFNWTNVTESLRQKRLGFVWLCWNWYNQKVARTRARRETNGMLIRPSSVQLQLVAQIQCCVI